MSIKEIEVSTEENNGSGKDEKDSEQCMDGCRDKEVVNNIFKPGDLSDLRSSKTIFEDLDGEKKQPKESEFLKTSVSKSSASVQNEIPGVVFKAGANLHKFVGEWENIGPGFVYVTRNKEKRCFFIRDGVMMCAFDFLATYDTRPTKKKLGVCIGVREVIENNCVEQPYCVVFKNENDANEFVRTMKI